MVTPAKKLEDLIHLAELCVDLLQQNEEHYAEVNQILVKYSRKHIEANFGAIYVKVQGETFFRFETHNTIPNVK